MATPDPPLCASCAQPLVLSIPPSDDEDDNDTPMDDSSATGSYVDDDVHLQCGCHFHWQCLLDTYTLSTCPSCSQPLISTSPTPSSSTEIPQEQILCTLRNEGGVQHNLDILPLLTEEAYLKAFPEERRAQAFLTLCAEGDVDAIVALLQDTTSSSSSSSDDDGDDDEMQTQPSSQAVDPDILRYQSPIPSPASHHVGSSALHIAISHNHPPIAWLILLLASTLPTTAFPADVVRAAEAMGLEREDQAGKVDVRGLRDGEGKTAEERARERGGVWGEWVGRGWLRGP